MAADGSNIPANVSRKSRINAETEVAQSMQSYPDALYEEFSNQPGFKKPPTRIVKKCHTASRTDPDCGYINHGSKRSISFSYDLEQGAFICLEGRSFFYHRLNCNKSTSKYLRCYQVESDA